ncbi:MAG: chemotaxis response regulator protein-glutamate methylesterase [Cellvibrionaceae bacterium]
MDLIKVLVVDDSPVVQNVLSEIISSDARLKVVGVAADPYEAREKIKLLNPDVLTLDIEMPRMDGITFLSKLMRLRPMPVVMISTLTEKGAPATLQALELGAVDFLAKPQVSSGTDLKDYTEVIIEKIIMASQCNVQALAAENEHEFEPSEKIKPNQQVKAGLICAIGASTGGTEAIKEVLLRMPVDGPPVVLAQHIPAVFSTSYAKRLDDNCDVKVFEAEDGQAIEPGCAYLAPGDKHLKIKKVGGSYRCVLDDGELVNRHKPSVEVLFDSVREVAGKNAVGVMLTGMGADGSEALLRMREAGCETIAQDEATSVVWGMPGVAVKLGGASQVLPLWNVAKAIMSIATKK